MLYDPKWEKQAETKADPLSLQSLILWLEKQPSGVPYDGCQYDECMLFQWLQSMDAGVRAGVGNSWGYKFRGQPISVENFKAIALSGSHTFGAALERARAAL